MKTKVLQFISIFILFIYTGSSVLRQYFLKYVVDTATLGKYNQMIFYILILSTCFLIYIIAAGFRPLIENKYKNAVLHSLRQQLINALHQKPTNLFSSEKRATYVSVLNNDIPLICQDYYMTTLDLIGCGMTILFSITALFSIHWVMTLIIIAGCVLIIVNPHFFTGESQKRKLHYTNCLKSMNQDFSDFMEGIQVVRAYQYETYLMEKLSAESLEISYADYRSTKIGMYINVIGTLLQCLQELLLIVVGVYFVFKGTLTAGGLLAVVQFNNIIALPVTIFASFWNTRVNGLAVKKKFDEEYVVSNTTEDNISIAAAKPLHYSVLTAEQVNFAPKGQHVLKNIHLQLDLHKKYLMIGESGSGKSSLFKILGKLEHNYSGIVKLDDVDIREIPDDTYFQNLIPVFQNAFLFQMDLLSNITLEQGFQADKANDIMQKLNMKSVWERMENQVITPNEMNLLSGGEKQRIALARALIREGQFYFMDEVTASVDKETRRQIEELMLTLDAGFLFATHNPEVDNLPKYDQIFILKDGEIIANGTYGEMRDAGFF